MPAPTQTLHAVHPCRTDAPSSLCLTPCLRTGFADDYAFLISGLLDLYEAGGGRRWLEWAVRLQVGVGRSSFVLQCISQRNQAGRHPAHSFTRISIPSTCATTALQVIPGSPFLLQPVPYVACVTLCHPQATQDALFWDREAGGYYGTADPATAPPGAADPSIRIRIKVGGLESRQWQHGSVRTCGCATCTCVRIRSSVRDCTGAVGDRWYAGPQHISGHRVGSVGVTWRGVCTVRAPEGGSRHRPRGRPTRQYPFASRWAAREHVGCKGGWGSQ